jgi:ABC-type bacteriocin/lantibiotic exporter with double-glycine peptidase domain
MLRFLAQTLVTFFCLGQILSAAGPQGVWLDVPFVKQEKNACGAAAVAMVMQYWSRQQGRPPGETADAAHIQNVLYSPDARGIYNSAIENYFRSQNFRTFTIRGQWSDLLQHLEKGRPLIVMLKPEHQKPLHYVVVTGLELAQNLVIVNDPAERKLLKLDRARFEKSWSAAGNWTLLAVPQQAAR